MEKVGKEGVITVADGKTLENELEVSAEGIQLALRRDTKERWPTRHGPGCVCGSPQHKTSPCMCNIYSTYSTIQT